MGWTRGFLFTVATLLMLQSCYARSAMTLEEFFNGLNGAKTQNSQEAAAEEQPRAEKPHIMLILGDDIGFGDIGYNNPEVKTPYIDQLAAEGITLTQSYYQSTCSPSRAALLTGKYPYKIGLSNIVFTQPNPACLPTDLQTLPEILKDGGYQTHMAGKWHLGSCSWACTPTARGFDSFLGLHGPSQDKFTHLEIGGVGDGYDFFNNTEVNIESFGEYTEILFRDRTLEVINNYQPGDDPLFMYTAFTAMHSPLGAPQAYLDLYPELEDGERKTALAMMSSIDDGIKDIVDALKEKGMWENTFLYFASDNGGAAGEASVNTPLNGCKESNFEGGTLVPTFINSPLLTRSGYAHDGLIHVVDVLPTLLSIAGIVPENPDYFDGVDQTDMLLHGGPSARNEIIYNLDKDYSGVYFNGGFALRQGDFKLLWGLPGNFYGRGEDCHNIIFSEDFLGRLGLSMDIYDPPPNSLDTHTPMSDQQSAVYALFEAAFGVTTVNRQNMNTTGLVTFYNLRDDPYEYIDLSADPAHADLIYEMKTRILDLVDDGYISAPESWYQPNYPADNPRNEPFNAYIPGWCSDVDFSIV